MLGKGSVAPKLGPPRGLARGTGLGNRMEVDVDWNSDKQVACWRCKDKREWSECVSEGDRRNELGRQETEPINPVGVLAGCL